MLLTSSGTFSLPPAAFSCPPPLKWSFEHLFAEVPFFDLIDTRSLPSSSLTRMLILTFAIARGIFTKPSVSPSWILYFSSVSLSITM